MFLSNAINRCAAVMICGMFLAITTVVADGTEESVVVEQTVKREQNRAPEEQLSKGKVEQEKLRKLMNFTLVGTVLSDAGKSVAIIEENRTNEQKFYRMGDLIRGVHITKILKDRIILTKDNIDIQLRMNSGTGRGTGTVKIEKGFIEPASPVSAEPAKAEEYDSGFPKIERAILDSIIHAEDFTIPVTTLDDGRFRVDVVKPDSAFSKLGFRSGDVVAFGVQIQDKGVSSSKAFAQGLQQRFGENILRMEVEHDGKMEMLYIEIEDSTEK